jgi:hypothetical protein
MQFGTRKGAPLREILDSGSTHFSLLFNIFTTIIKKEVKKRLLITLLVLLAAGGFLLYNFYLAKPPLDKWDLVPAETVLVYESSDCKDCINTLENSPVVELIRNASLTTEENDTLNSIQKFILSFQQPTLVSLHITKKDEFDFAYYVSNSANFQQKIGTLLQQLGSIKGVRSGVRTLNEVEIHELFFRNRTFSWAVFEDVWVASFSPIIIEDIIRTGEANDKNSFKSVLNPVYQLPRIKNDGGNLYVHLKNLGRLLSLFTKSPTGFMINDLGHSSLLDIKRDDNRVVLNGFSYHPPAKNEYFLSAFAEQTPVEFTVKNVISNRSLLVSHLGLSDGEKFFKRMNALSRNPHLDTLRLIQEALGSKASGFFSSSVTELSECFLESRTDDLTKILILKNDKNPGQLFELFKGLSEKFSTDTLFIDRYSDYEIFEMPVHGLPEKLFHPLIKGYKESYYTAVGSSLLVAEDIEELKKFLDDIDTENTWGKSVAQNRFFESTLLESNLSLFLNTGKTWHILEKNAPPKWQEFFQRNKDLITQLGMGAIQFSHLNDTYYTNISIGFKESKQGNKPEPSNRYVTNFGAGIALFTTVRNHADNTTELIVQDSAKTVFLVSNDGKIQWQKTLPDFVSGEIHQIDFFANGKLQYLFATPGALHIIDRLGNYVSPFPVEIKEKKIAHLSVIDYDHSKKYRFLVTSAEGRLWMYDKEGKNLEGWQPRAVDEQLITGVRHHRILGKDYLIAVRTDGVVFLMNRRGELLKNFPLDLNTRLQGDYFLEVGKKISNTYFTVVSSEGIKIRFNLHGKIESQDVVVKNEADAKFQLITEENFKSFVIVRQERKDFTIFNDNLNELIKSDFIADNPADIKYYSFGNGRDYIAITDKSQQLSFVYDKKGALVTSVPIDSDVLVLQQGDGDKLKVYYSRGKNITIEEIP